MARAQDEVAGWREIAVAAEEAAGISAPAGVEESQPGYMFRAAEALRQIGSNGTPAVINQANILSALGLSLAGNGGKILAVKANGSGFELIAAPSPTPAPAFTTQPSISPTSGTAGTTLFTATDGVASNSTGLTRRWLLGTTPIGTGTTITPSSAGSLTLEVTATGAGGTTIATSAAVTVAAAPAPLYAPTSFALASNTAYPPALDIILHPNTVEDTWLDVEFDDNRDRTSPTVISVQLTADNINGTDPINIQAELAGIASPAQTYFWASNRQGTDRSARVGPILHGDTTAPVLTIAPSASVLDGATVSHAWSSTEYVTLSFTGPDGGAVESVPAGGTSGVIRLVGNAAASAATNPAIDFTVTATDDAGLSDTETVSIAVSSNTSTFDPANAMADEYLALSPDKRTMTITTTDIGSPFGSRMTNSRTGKRFLPFKINNGPFRPMWGVCDTDRAWGNGDSTFGDYSIPGTGGKKGSSADAIAGEIWPSGASMTSDIGAGEWVAVAFETIDSGADAGKVKVWYHYEGAWRGDPVAGTGNELTAVMASVYGFMAAYNAFSASVYPSAALAAAASCPIALPSGFTFYDG